MKNNVAQRTKEDVVEYIKTHSKDGKLTESLMSIASELGYSNATIHRALRNLEANGVVQIIESELPAKPNTIVFNGKIESIDDFSKKGQDIVNRLSAMMAEVQEYVSESNRLIGHLNHPQEKFAEKVIEKVELPDGKHYMLMVKKEDFDNANKPAATAHESAPQTLPSHVTQ